MNSNREDNTEKLIHQLKILEAVIFDMDGVLVNSEPHHVAIEKKLFQKMGLSVSDEEHAGYIGIATDAMWKKVKRNHHADFDVDEMVELNYKECNRHFSSLEELEPMPGILVVLKLFLDKNIPMAVASSSSLETIEIILEKAGLRTFFEQVVSSTMVNNSKPAPDIFLHAAGRLKVEPEKCMVVEDSFNGVKAAKAAGMYCVAFAGAENSQPQTGADIRINHFKELECILKKFFERH